MNRPVGYICIRRSVLPALLIGALLGHLPAPAQAQLLNNGGFETGDLTGWTVLNRAGSDPSGAFTIGNNAIDANLTPNSPATPISELASVGAKSGAYYAVSDSLGPGTHVLLQPFTLPTTARAVLSFDMFVNDWNGAGALNANGPLDHNQRDGNNNLIPTQFARVDLLRNGADPFSTSPGDVLENLYLGVDPGTPANDYTAYQFDLSNIVSGGDTYQLRFAEADNQFPINMGVDNVRVSPATPEPGTLSLLLGMGIIGTAALRGHRRRRVSLSPAVSHRQRLDPDHLNPVSTHTRSLTMKTNNECLSSSPSDLEQRLLQAIDACDAARRREEEAQGRYLRADLRVRLLGVLALTIVVGTVALSTLKPVVAQGGYGPTLTQLANRLAAVEKRVADLEGKTKYITTGVDSNGYPATFFASCNVWILSGSGRTDNDTDSGAKYWGLGNLIIGYNEPRVRINDPNDRYGSHNLIIGSRQNYTSYGGLVAGEHNTISGANASVSGGQGNTASEAAASVSGGVGNIASGGGASVSGGESNKASGLFASVSGGENNIASGRAASVSGGESNIASGPHPASVSGGAYNEASGWNTSVSGGNSNTAREIYSSISGGSSNKTSGRYASVSGGYSNEASGTDSSVSGGNSNIASGQYASVSGGQSNTAGGTPLSGGDFTSILGGSGITVTKKFGHSP
jgi:hypothetical protein